MRVKACQNLSELRDGLRAANDKLVVVAFLGKKSQPFAEEIENTARFQRRVVFLRVNILDFDTEVATLITKMQSTFKALPMFILLRDFEVVGEIVGPKFENLKEAIAKHKLRPIKRPIDSKKKVAGGSVSTVRKFKKSNYLPFIRF